MKKKKILYICQYFYPETFRGNDIAFHLAEKGHNVHVVTGIPNYPVGTFFKGYSWFKKRNETINGIRVTRLSIIPRGNNKIMLMLNYFSFFIVAWIYILFHSIGHKYDKVFVQQLSPVMMSAPGVLYKRLRKVPLYTWVLDLWPESLKVAGGINNKWILSFFDYYVKNEYKYSDRILISSRSFTDSILEYGNYQDKIIYFPQWFESVDSNIEGQDCQIPDLPDGFKLMFAGAVGDAHGFECTMQAALLTKEHKDIKWIIVGDGRRLAWVRNFVKKQGLEDTVFTVGRYPVETMPLFFKQADVMLVTLNDDPLYSLYAPAKISAYMAAARPIIAVLNGEGADVINEAECGWSLPAGDAEGFAKLAIELSQLDKNVLEEKGTKGLEYYNKYFTKKKCLEHLDRIMELS